jgi:hypothetical protein
VTKFNKALKETAYGTGAPRLIDGIMLTKFDTIDDKVLLHTQRDYSIPKETYHIPKETYHIPKET